MITNILNLAGYRVENMCLDLEAALTTMNYAVFNELGVIYKLAFKKITDSAFVNGLTKDEYMRIEFGDPINAPINQDIVKTSLEILDTLGVLFDWAFLIGVVGIYS